MNANTSDTEAFEKYARALGKVLANFHSLETSLRLFLQSHEISLNPNKVWVQIKAAPVGQTVPLDSFSSYDSLNGLIKKFNAIVTSKSQSHLSIDNTIIELRDALAHGRVWSQSGALPFQLLKFSKPVQGSLRVTVTHAEVMDDAWLGAQVKRVLSEAAKVIQAGNILYPANWNQGT